MSSQRVQTNISAMNSDHYRTSSPVTALPMIMRWISDVPAKMVKLLIVAPFTRSSPWRSL